MGALHVVGVRHHSPACARLVAHVIREVRPRHVLIEGPADWNERLDELRLDHTLPIAIFTFERGPARDHASWTPFCNYSPEHVALKVADEVGAAARFFDLPAWHPAFEGLRNRFADRLGLEERSHASRYVEALCRELGVDDVDTLWDHLFEQPMPLSALRERLATYFERLRADEPGGDRDGPREDFMAASVAWAMRDGGDVVVVCGGYHAPAIERLWEDASPAAPALDPSPPPDTRRGSYLVPYSEKRLDAFAGYEAGMPSPAFQEAVWTHGADAACEALLQRAVASLRAKRQHVSTADLIACLSVARGLAQLRGHAALARTDLLDAVASALVKDALEVPLPWSRRGPLLPRTDPLIVAVVSAFSGEQRGKLGAGTPRPPLAADVEAILAAHDLDPRATPREVRVRLADPRERDTSRVLHRLRVLGVPGIQRVAGPGFATDAELEERWMIVRHEDADAALIEAASYGGTLESAATARLEEGLIAAGASLARLAGLLGEAAFTGIDTLSSRVVGQIASAVASEPSLGELGEATHRLFDLYRHGDLVGASQALVLARVLEAAFDRGLWLLEGVSGAEAPADTGHLRAIVALRDLVRRGATLVLDVDRAAGVMERRSVDLDAPPAIRGGALGWLWSLGLGSEGADWVGLGLGSEVEAGSDAETGHAHVDVDVDGDGDLGDGDFGHGHGHGHGDVGDVGGFAALAVRGAARPSTLGDFLAGLFALAREEVLESAVLVGALDEVLQEMTRDDFLVALPSLRFAYSWFPPRERERFARRVLAHRGEDVGEARSLLSLPTDAARVAGGYALEARVDAIEAKYGLGPSEREEAP
ncbi:MAG: hypothetical protein KF901_18490 [Myxococcales bacterium]|nr:hypothetical protein [Myxococcales bacterium]